MLCFPLFRPAKKNREAVQDSLQRTIVIALLGCVPLMPLLVLPVMVGSFVDGFGLAENEAGWVASAGFLGGSVGALGLAFRIHHLDLHRLAFLGLVVMTVADGASIAANSMPIAALVAARFVSGFASALVYGSVMSAYAGFREPDRAYGLYMALQFAVSAAGLYLLPSVLPVMGVAGIFILFTAMDLAGLLAVARLPGREERASRVKGLKLEWEIIFTVTAIACLLAIGLFETAQMAQFTYVERIGVAIGLEADQVGLALGLSSLLGIPAAFAVTWLGSRFGYFKPIAAAIMLEFIAIAILINATTMTHYLTAACLFAVGWAFVLPYFQAIEARIDPGGSVVVAGGFATGAAGFLGPAGAALLVAPGHYVNMLLGVGACLVVVILLTRFVTLRIGAVDN